jgi:hypothetical protein
MTPKREVLDISSGRFLTTGSSLPLAEITTADLQVASRPLDVAPELPTPAEEFLVGISLEGSIFFKYFFLSGCNPRNMGDLKGYHPQCPIRVEGINTAAWCPEGIVSDTDQIPLQCYTALSTIPHTLA